MATFDYQAAQDAGYSPQEIQDYIQSHPEVSPGPSNNILTGNTLPMVGMGLGGLIGTVLGPAGTVVGAGAGYGGLDAVRRGLLDLNNQQVPGVHTIANPGSGQVNSTQLMNEYGSGPRNAAIMAALLRGAPTMWKYLTTGGIGRILQDQYQKSTDAGNAIDINPTIDSMKQAALNKVGQGDSYNQFTRWLTKNIPGSPIIENTQLGVGEQSPTLATPNEAWTLAKQVGGNLEGQAGNAFRAAYGPISEAAKSVTPGVGLPNFLSHIYQSSHLDPVKLILGGGGLFGLAKTLFGKAQDAISPPSGY